MTYALINPVSMLRMVTDVVAGRSRDTLFVAMREWFARREMYKQTVRELNCMSDRELDDLGIPRCDIPRIAEESTNRLHDRRG